ncbi:MAG: cytochrome b/b6 domain-containing protein, partial [Pseudomonadota bacterium]
MPSETTDVSLPEHYSATARAFHWLTVAAVALLIASGLWMTSRSSANIWDVTTNALYSGHKLLGFLLLGLIILRLGYRLMKGAPPDPVTLTPVQK